MIPPDNRIFVQVEEGVKQVGEIVLVKEMRENMRGKVTAVGSEVEGIETGETVIFPKNFATEIEGGLYSVLVNPDKILICG